MLPFSLTACHTEMHRPSAFEIYNIHFWTVEVNRTLPQCLTYKGKQNIEIYYAYKVQKTDVL